MFEKETVALVILNDQSDETPSSSRDDRNVSNAPNRPTEGRRWQSMHATYCTAYCTFMLVACALASMGPYLQSLDPSSSSTSKTVVISAFIMSQCVSSLLLAAVAKYLGRSKLSIVMALLCSCLGSVIYCLLENLPTPQTRTVGPTISVVFIGWAAGAAGVLWAHIANVTSETERTGCLAITALCQILGMVNGLFLNVSINIFNYIGPINIAFGHVNSHTAPVWLGLALCLFSLVLVIIYFCENPRKEGKGEQASTEPMYEGPHDQPKWNIRERLVSLDLWAVMGLFLSFFVAQFALSLLSMVLEPLTMDEFAWSKTDASRNWKLVMLTFGICSSGILAGLILCSKRIRLNESMIQLGGLILLACAFFACIPWGGQYPVLKDVNEPSPLDEKRGCPLQDKPWCNSVPGIKLYQLYLGLLCLTMGYAPSSVLSMALLSKVLGHRNQNLWMGLLSSLLCCAHILGTLMVKTAYRGSGPKLLFFLAAGIVSVAAAYIFCVYRRITTRHALSTPSIRENANRQLVLAVQPCHLVP